MSARSIPSAPTAVAATVAAMAPYRQFICHACGWIYDEAQGDPDSGLAPGTRFEDIPQDWSCPLCGVTKADFSPYEAPSLDDLRARIRKTIEHVQSFSAAQIDGSDERAIAIPTRSGDPLNFSGETFLKHFALPNFFFHVTTAYDLLRHNGLEIGKSDYLGRA